MCSFFICDDDWSKNTEITLVEMDTSSEVDNYIMEDTRLEELRKTNTKVAFCLRLYD